MNAPAHVQRYALPRASAASLMLLGSAVLLPSAACGGDDYRIHDDDDGTATTNAGGSAGSSSTSSAGGSAACAATSGSYLFALSLSLLPSAPILFDSQVTVTDSSNGGQLTMTLQPIDRCDRATLVGSPTVVGPVPLDGDGSFSTTIDSVTVPEEANPLTGTDLVAVIELSGTFCALDFNCGDAAGVTTLPPSIDLTGSTWTLERVDTAGVYPDPPSINCTGDPAGPAPSACP